MKLLAETLFQLDLGMANVYLLSGKQGLILIDAASEGSLAKLERKLGSLGYRLKDIRHILITHAHVDHVGGLKEIQRATQAEVWAHTLEAPIIRGEALPELPLSSSLSLQDNVMGKMIGLLVGKNQNAAPVHRELTAGQSLDELFDGLELLHLPGHSKGHSGFYFPHKNLLIGGDVMMHLTPWLSRPLAAYTSDRTQADKSILLVNTLGLETLAVGHGAALHSNAAEAIANLARKIERQLISEHVSNVSHQ